MSHAVEAEQPLIGSAANLFVFASRAETQGLVLLEAMALGVPVVSTAVMGTKTVLARARGAIVVPEEVSTFAAAVTGLLRDPARRQVLGALAQQDMAVLVGTGDGPTVAESV